MRVAECARLEALAMSYLSNTRMLVVTLRLHVRHNKNAMQAISILFLFRAHIAQLHSLHSCAKASAFAQDRHPARPASTPTREYR